MLQEVLIAQARMSEAIDALARQVETSSPPQGSSSVGSLESSVQGQLNAIQSVLASLTGVSKEDGSPGMGAELALTLDRMHADIKGLNIKVDNLSSRMNKNIATINSKMGEIITFAIRASTEKDNLLSGIPAGSADVRGWASKALVFATWLGGIGIAAILSVILYRWRKTRAEGGGRGKKMI